MEQLDMFVDKSPDDYAELELYAATLEARNEELEALVIAMEEYIEELAEAYTDEFSLSPEQLLQLFDVEQG